MRLVLATANPHKAAEIVALLAEFEVVPRPVDLPDVEETEDTLEGNAQLKAQAVFAATGEAAVADDTGLEVEALGGAPGVYSARYAGPDATYADNVATLLRALAGLRGASARRARFRTVAVVVLPGGGVVQAEGWVDGSITSSPRGTNGFGYDPIFVPDDGDGRTFAEMSATEKASCSHRARAFGALAMALEPFRPGGRPGSAAR